MLPPHFHTVIHYLYTLSKIPVLISPAPNNILLGITPGCPNYSHMGPHQTCHINAQLCLTLNAHGAIFVTAETALAHKR